MPRISTTAPVPIMMLLECAEIELKSRGYEVTIESLPMFQHVPGKPLLYMSFRGPSGRWLILWYPSPPNVEHRFGEFKATALEETGVNKVKAGQYGENLSTEWLMNIEKNSSVSLFRLDIDLRHSLKSFLDSAESACVPLFKLKSLVEILGGEADISRKGSLFSEKKSVKRLYPVKASLSVRFPNSELASQVIRMEPFPASQVGRTKREIEAAEVEYSMSFQGQTMSLKKACFSTDCLFQFALKRFGLDVNSVNEIVKKNRELPVGSSLAEIKHVIRGRISAQKFGF